MLFLTSIKKTKNLLKTLTILEKTVKEITESLSILEKDEVFDNGAIDVLKRSRMEAVKYANNISILVEPFIIKCEDDFKWIKNY